jgi:catechol 2,3-dioxygenase-like lactoylglutathione lyase family enzyme
MIDFKRIDHVLVCVPVGAREAARTFYADTLGLSEIPGEHPKGSLWFRIGSEELHVREEDLELQISGRHVAFEVPNLEGAKSFLQERGIEVAYSSVISGRDRCFFRDPWSNRFELIEFDQRAKNPADLKA